MYAPALWAAALLLTLRRRRSAAALVALTAADLVIVGQGYHPALPQAQLYPTTPLTRRMTNDAGLHRFTALGEALIPDAHMAYGLADVRGLDFRTAWYDDYLGLLPDRIEWIDYGVILASTTSPLLRVLNLAYVAGTDPPTLRGSEGLRIVEETGSVALGRAAGVQPRSYLVYEASAVGSDAEALAQLRAEPASVFRRAVLVAPAGADAPPSLAPSGAPPAGEVTLVDYGARAASWRVRTARPAYLVTTDAWYPGWQASVDGRPAPVYRANGAFRAVHVDAGEHVVAYRFAPASVRLGLAISGATVLVLVVVLVFTRRSRAP
jgi:hypothetical protein